MRGLLPTVIAVPLTGDTLANPATAIALANQPTATPNYAACPQIASPQFPEALPAGRDINGEIARFLSGGGSVGTLEGGLRNDWNVLGETGLIRSDVDMTGEGQPEIIIAYDAPDGGGSLVVLGCIEGRYTTRYEFSPGGEIPRIIQLGDMNRDNRPDLLFSSRVCAEGNACNYQTQLITWRPDLGRMVSLLVGAIVSPSEPAISDVDNDEVAEIAIQITDDGNAETGPQRTGVNVYDWNGSVYVLSIIQLDPPRYYIEVIHEADKAFAVQDMELAASLYNLVLNDSELRDWAENDAAVLRSYALFRLLLAYAYTEDERRLDVYQASQAAYIDPAASPIYANLVTVFWDALQVSNNLHSACQSVLDIIRIRPEAVDLLNRYGDRSPVYTPETICPF